MVIVGRELSAATAPSQANTMECGLKGLEYIYALHKQGFPTYEIIAEETAFACVTAQTQ